MTTPRLDEACACLHVDYQPIDHDDGTKAEAWWCRDCHRPFVPVARMQAAVTAAMELGAAPPGCEVPGD